MPLVSSEPVVLIGPGSERFWTALSGLVLAVTFVAIYRQLRLQRSAAAIEQLNSIAREWQSERMGQSLLPSYARSRPEKRSPTDQRRRSATSGTRLAT